MENNIQKISNNKENNEYFDIEILTYLGDKHKELMNELQNEMNNFKTDRDIYDYINKYMTINVLKQSFPIGISINHVIAHNSYHEHNLIILRNGDFITIDVGFIENGNIIDAARTFNYKSNIHKSIIDCELYVDKIEKYIRKELKNNGKVKIQDISKLTNILVSTGGYTGVGLMGGHDVKLNKVHGDKIILGKPLTSLPTEVSNLINKDEILSKNEMFCIEIYMSERFTDGMVIQSTKTPITHYELDEKADINYMNNEEKKVFECLKEKINGLVYYYTIHKEFNDKDNKTIKNLINKKFIVSHYPIEFKSVMGELIKFTQHENTFIITNDGELINLTKNTL